MEFAVIAARWAVTAALRSVSDGLNESWAASSQLGANVRDLQMELLYVQWMLDDVYGRGVKSPHLEQMMLELHHQAYDANNLLDELEYFRIQDKLEGTDETGDADARGLVGGLLLNCRHTARAVVRKLKLPSCSCAFVCGHHIIRGQKLKLDRVAMSKRVVEITDRLKPVCVKVSAILNYEILATIASGSTIGSTQKHNPSSQKKKKHNPRAPQIKESRFYGRDDLIKYFLEKIFSKYCANNLTVLSIVGPGGIGKTALTQQIYKEVESHFQVSVWICVSRDFNANRLAQIITKQIPKVDHENGFESVDELIQKRLKSKRLLLVLDDMWSVYEDEWKKLLAPFTKAEKGSIVIVTTRIPKVAETTADHMLNLDCLTEEECMCFLKACVFDENQTWDCHPGLHDVGREIMKRLGGFPLAVKIIGSLLKTELTLDHWVRILESKEWEYQASYGDIMPALKLSYKHLPSHLQQCFSYCALFPEDYEFGTEEIIHLWIGLGLLGPDDQNNKIEDIGLGYLNDLVGHGFFQDHNVAGVNYYYIHDLLHDLPKTVSAYECLRIRGSDVRSCRSIQIPRSVRHISITIENADVQDKTTFENCNRGLFALGKRLKVGNLSTLMLFGDHHGSFCKLFGDMFREAKDLRAIFLSGASYDVKDLLPCFSQLIHLRYLRINGYVLNGSGLFNSITRFYHLLVLDLKECSNIYSTEHMCVSIREMSKLVKIRHFLVPNDSYHSEIFEVGRLESIQELRRFEVKREKCGFELNQLGKLLQLQGSLEIHNLEKVEETIEVNDIELFQLHCLNRLVLEWDINRSNRAPRKEQDVLGLLQPPTNLQEMQIIGHGGDTYPTWLRTDQFIKNLECLCLIDVSWESLPPSLGEFSMVGGRNLRRLKLVNVATLKTWSVNSPFSNLEELIVDGCSELTELPVSHMFPNLKRLILAKLAVSYMFPNLKNLEPANIETQEEWSSNTSFSKLENLIVDRCPKLIELAHPDMFPNLQEMDIYKCERLMSVPPIPWTSALCEARVMGVGAHISSIYYKKDSQNVEASFKNNTLDCDLCNVLDFSKLSEIRDLSISGCPTFPLDHLRLLKSLKILHIGVSGNVLWPAEGENNAQFRFPVEELKISSYPTMKELARLISYFPNLLKLSLWRYHIKQGVEETEAPGEGHIQIHELLQNQSSLISLSIEGCKEEACSISFPSSCHPLLSSLQSLSLERVKFNTFELDGPLTNLVELSLNECEGLGSEDLWHFLSQGHLKKLIIIGNYNLFDVLEPSRMGGQDLPHSSRPETDETEGEIRTVHVPTGQTFPSSLTDLTLCNNGDMKQFTNEQSEALQMFSSIQFLNITGYSSLQALPEGLTQLWSLKTLKIDKCSSIRSLPKRGLPRSLVELYIWSCDSIQSLPKGTLPASLTKLEVDGCKAFRSLPTHSFPNSLRELRIINCPAIQSLHVESLPSSLGRLDVTGSNKKLQRQCEKLRGTIPIVEFDYSKS